MAQLIFTRSFQRNRAIRTHSVFPFTFKIGKFFLMFSVIIVIGLLSFVYLVNFTQLHTKGYQLRRLELEKEKLISVREVQNTNIAKLKSLATLQESNVINRMIPARNPIFIKRDGSFAKLP